MIAILWLNYSRFQDLVPYLVGREWWWDFVVLGHIGQRFYTLLLVGTIGNCSLESLVLKVRESHS